MQCLPSLVPLPSVPVLPTLSYSIMLRKTCSDRCWTDLGKSTCQVNPYGFSKGTHKHFLYMQITHTIQIIVTGRPICKWCFSCDIQWDRISNIGIPCSFKSGKKNLDITEYPPLAFCTATNFKLPFPFLFHIVQLLNSQT